MSDLAVRYVINLNGALYSCLRDLLFPLVCVLLRLEAQYQGILKEKG